ncbi:MAG: LuxR C-terminal-related transcriptional regulator [Sulfurifustaceae bacterium]
MRHLAEVLSQGELAVILRIFDVCFSAQTMRQLLSACRMLDKIVSTDLVVAVVVRDPRRATHASGVGVWSTHDVTELETSLCNLYETLGTRAFESFFAGDGTRLLALDRGAQKSPRHDKTVECLRTTGRKECVVSVRTVERMGLKTVFILGRDALWADSSCLPVIEYLAPHLHSALARISLQESAPIKALSRREKEVLRWISAGKTSWETSRILRIAERTVVFHAQNAMRKLGATSRAQAIALAFQHGLLQPPKALVETVERQAVNAPPLSRSRAAE